LPTTVPAPPTGSPQASKWPGSMLCALPIPCLSFPICLLSQLLGHVGMPANTAVIRARAQPQPIAGPGLVESRSAHLTPSLVSPLPQRPAACRHVRSDARFFVSGALLLPPHRAPCRRNGRHYGRQDAHQRAAREGRAISRRRARRSAPAGCVALPGRDTAACACRSAPCSLDSCTSWHRARPWPVQVCRTDFPRARVPPAACYARSLSPAYPSLSWRP
jgi:hypothetical protein